MDWDKKKLHDLEILFLRKHMEMRDGRKTDRRNFSAIWNRYLKNYGVVLLADGSLGGGRSISLRTNTLLSNLMDLVNYRNEEVSGALIVANPDRPGQYLVVQRDIAERIMVLGML